MRASCGGEMHLPDAFDAVPFLQFDDGTFLMDSGKIAESVDIAPPRDSVLTPSQVAGRNLPLGAEHLPPQRCSPHRHQLTRIYRCEGAAPGVRGQVCVCGHLLSRNSFLL